MAPSVCRWYSALGLSSNLGSTAFCFSSAASILSCSKLTHLNSNLDKKQKMLVVWCKHLDNLVGMPAPMIVAIICLRFIIRGIFLVPSNTSPVSSGSISQKLPFLYKNSNQLPQLQTWPHLSLHLDPWNGLHMELPLKITPNTHMTRVLWSLH